MPPSIQCAMWSPTHLVADAHVWCHDDLVSLAVNLRAPQELSLGCGDVVVAAMVAKLDALLRYQKHALCHILIRRFRWVAEEPLCDFLCGQNMQRREGGFCACSVCIKEGLSRPMSPGVQVVDLPFLPDHGVYDPCGFSGPSFTWCRSFLQFPPQDSACLLLEVRSSPPLQTACPIIR